MKAQGPGTPSCNRSFLRKAQSCCAGPLCQIVTLLSKQVRDVLETYATDLVREILSCIV
ncbi:hypothetical protein BDZ94DRAFT_48958 [Collybia nuda]|uniref:Uncharacterized protein n=1 Tax=Collybia nuda TaxID=64659 RepID=A0A9P5YJZ7_9AGAR|nr:hypothetical protein BDZ94DRAFT_48958 [Collybia nuda]